MNLAEATTLADHLDRAAARWQHDALVMPGKRYSFPEFAARAEHFARGLRALGVEPGDKVGVLMPNAIDYPCVVFGAAKLGAIPVPVNSRFKTHELGYVIAHADLRVLFTSDSGIEFVDYPALLREAFPDLAEAEPAALSLAAAPELRQVVLLGDSDQPGLVARADFEAGAERVDPDEVHVLQERVRIRDVAMIMYTSGTTANPKGCMLSHEALVRNGFNYARTRWFLTPEDRLWDPLPFFHMSTVLPLLGCLAGGATYVGMERFEPELALRQLEEERCTVAFPSFETIWLAVLGHPRFADTDLSALRQVNNVGVPERLEAMQRELPFAVQVSAFGATEGAGVIAFNLPDDPPEKRFTTQGLPFPGIEVRIVDPDTGAVLPPGERGEIQYRGYSNFEGYYKDPEKTAEVVDADGWFHSGDLGTLDEDGRVAYQGRLKDMLKVGGENVAAAEIEGFLARHEAVEIVQVVGAPDAHYVEVPAAFVQLKEGATAGERELVEFCAGSISTFKVPRYIRFVDDWPMSGTKIQKYKLRERIERELEAAGITEAPRIELKATGAQA
jgi:fatty-acyl-CoA synthase